jgi:hypothetical protein
MHGENSKEHVIKKNLVKKTNYLVFIGIFNFLGGRLIDTCVFPFFPFFIFLAKLCTFTNLLGQL